MESALRFAKWRIHWAAYTREGKGGGGVLQRILGEGVPTGFPNPDPISDPKMSSSTPVFRPDL